MIGDVYVKNENGEYAKLETTQSSYNMIKDYIIKYEEVSKENHSLNFKLGYKEKQLKRAHKTIQREQDKLYRIRTYLENKNNLDVGYFIEDEEGRDVFIDVKKDILDIVREER